MELKGKNASAYIIHSQEEEIKRIAFELHEGISQNLYSLYTGLGFLESGLEDPNLKKYSKEMASLLERTIEEVKLLSVELYPATLKTLGLISALKSYVRLYTSTFGILIDIESQGEEWEISEQKSMAVFRVCQEALINIAKYADTANAVLKFKWEENNLKIKIEDAGKGFNLEEVKQNNTVLGISAMEERMKLVGGDCLVSSEVEKGTTVSINLPIQ